MLSSCLSNNENLSNCETNNTENGMWNQKKICHSINAKIILKPLTASLFNI